MRNPLGIQIADSLHPVANPAVDREGNVYSTFSGSRGQKSPVSIYKIDTNYNSKPFVTDLMNPDRPGLRPRRHALRLQPLRRHHLPGHSDGNMSVYVEGMGVATGIAFDREENLYVGDRSGTFSRSAGPARFMFRHARAVHRRLSSGVRSRGLSLRHRSDDVELRLRLPHHGAGEVETFYRGLGRPQGLAFDAEGNLYVAASLAGRRGVIRIDADRKAEQFLSGPGIVGLAFTPSRAGACHPQCAVSRRCRTSPGWPLP